MQTKENTTNIRKITRLTDRSTTKVSVELSWMNRNLLRLIRLRRCECDNNTKKVCFMQHYTVSLK